MYTNIKHFLFKTTQKTTGSSVYLNTLISDIVIVTLVACGRPPDTNVLVTRTLVCNI